MSVKLLNEGALRINRYLQGADTVPLKLIGCLYVGAVTPAVTNVLADFPLCTLTGYVEEQFKDQTFIGGVSLGVASFTTAPAVMTLDPYGGADTTIFGFVIREGNSTVGLWAGDFSPPLTVPHQGAALAVTFGLVDKLAT